MSPAETGAAQIRRLLAEIGADRAILRTRGEELRSYCAAADGPERTLAIALTLDRVYTALESILERIARTMEGGPPAGEDWHRALLVNARLEIPGIRVAVLSGTSVEAADELRRFRHFLRQAYGADLDATRLRHLAARWLERETQAAVDLDEFADFLKSVATKLERS